MFTSTMTNYYCQSCDAVLDNEGAATTHENQNHDGAQTCWSAEELQDERRRMWEENEAENQARVL